MNRCPKIEYGRLSSEIAWMGVNTRTITSKKATITGGIQRLSLNRTSAPGGATEAAAAAERETARNRRDTVVSVRCSNGAPEFTHSKRAASSSRGLELFTSFSHYISGIFRPAVRSNWLGRDGAT